MNGGSSWKELVTWLNQTSQKTMTMMPDESVEESDDTTLLDDDGEDE